MASTAEAHRPTRVACVGRRRLVVSLRGLCDRIRSGESRAMPAGLRHLRRIDRIGR